MLILHITFDHLNTQRVQPGVICRVACQGAHMVAFCDEQRQQVMS